MFKSSRTVFPQPSKTTRVQIDSGTVLRIIKHAFEQHPSQASGQLLGLESTDDDLLSITYTFPYPNNFNDNDGISIKTRAATKYQQEFIELAKEVNIEANSVGFYIGATLGKFYSQGMVDALIQYQTGNPEAVMLVYDVSRSVQAGFSLRAFRVSQQYLNVAKNGHFVSDVLEKEGLSYDNILDELTVDVKNSHLVTLYLQGPTQFKDYNNLNVTIDSYLEHNIENILDSVDEFNYDLNTYNYYQRQSTKEKLKIQQWQQKRKAENASRQANGKPLLPTDEWKTLFKLPEEPSRLEKLLISAQLDQYCSQIEQFGSSVSTKMFAGKKALEM